MPTITITTIVNATPELCFDLSRSIDLHTISTKHTGEQAVAGVTSGLIDLNETVTWKAKHFGIWQHLTSKITEYNRPAYFVDEMVKGAFARFRHEHHFKQQNNQTIITDIFDYTSPLGILGRVADRLFLKTYLHKLLLERNRVIKSYAEFGKWQEIIPAIVQE
ncbi:SRPBCC family protein [Pontibacter populi]|uniref:SRPBCC family protein n=1 Tax=Pontibacter populi TaxID=890055 RepID=A0ABV1RZ42_9BACT